MGGWEGRGPRKWDGPYLRVSAFFGSLTPMQMRGEKLQGWGEGGEGAWGVGVGVGRIMLFKRGVVFGEGVCTDMQILMTEKVLRGKVVSVG